VSSISAYKANQRDLNIWVGETHDRTQGRYLLMHLAAEIEFQNLISLYSDSVFVALGFCLYLQ
jgi:hypothetical protein